MKCKEKREAIGVAVVSMKDGKPAQQGKCQNTFDQVIAAKSASNFAPIPSYLELKLKSRIKEKGRYREGIFAE